MNIKCEHPVIIENPYLKYLVSKYQKVYMNGRWLNLSAYDCFKPVDVVFNRHNLHGDVEEYHDTENIFVGKVSRNRTIWSDWNSKYHPLFWKTRTGVTLDNIDDFYVVSPDGEIFPVYMVVPCGKCSLCREKKVKMWMTRCLAETVTSNYPPLFITLTYRDADLPADGVNIVDYQKFLKRLRIRLERHFGKKFNLRYLIVAEYGTQKKRPHYHMLLWNMPFIDCPEDGKSSWQALHDYIQDAWSHGWIGIDRCKDASGKYCMKYMRKECEVPEGCNPCFMRSSRRRGIGYQCAENLRTWISQNPGATSIDLTNPFDGSTTTCVIPDYFKRIWFPSLSVIVPQQIRDRVASFMDSARNLAWFYDRIFTLVDVKQLTSDLYKCYDDVAQKYSYCIENFEDIYPDSVARKDMEGAVSNFCSSYVNRSRPNLVLGLDWYKSMLHDFNVSYSILMNSNIDKAHVMMLLDLHSRHSELMKLAAESAPEFNVVDEVARVARQNARIMHNVSYDDDCYLLEE